MHRVAKFVRAVSLAALVALAADASVAAPVHGYGLWRGRDVQFQVVDGDAVVEGDIVIGRAADLAQALAAAGSWTDTRKGFSLDDPTVLWLKGPSGVIEVPYRVDIDPDGRVPAAVAAFNAQFAGFIQFVPFASQPDFVAFTLSLPDGAAACNSRLGRVGGKQNINGPRTCSVGSLLHEMGHAIGLRHEHTRADRDLYLDVVTPNIVKNERSQFTFPQVSREIVTPYDFASIMHYGDFGFSGNALPALITIPQGIGIGQRDTYSAADVDTLRRLYGAAPAAITVTSDPPGMLLVVDGATVSAPQTFDWPLGSAHVIGVGGTAQTLAGAPHVFGRWNVDVAGDGAAQRAVTVTAGLGSPTQPTTAPAVTVYTAHFVRVFAVTIATSGDTTAARAATSVSVTPPAQPYAGLAGAYYRANQVLRLDASVGPGFTFGGWQGRNFSSLDSGFGAASLLVKPFSFNDPPTMSVTGLGSTTSIWRVHSRATDGTVDRMSVKIDSATTRTDTPTTSANAKFKPGETHVILATTPQFLNAATARYIFTDWDGAHGQSGPGHRAGRRPATRARSPPTSPRSSRSAITSNSTCAGQVTVSRLPPPTATTTSARSITAKASPGPGWTFATWTGDLAGAAATAALVVTGEVFMGAEFNTVPVPLALTRLGRAFVVVGEPDFDLTVNGTGIHAGLRRLDQRRQPRDHGVHRRQLTMLCVHVNAGRLLEAGRDRRRRRQRGRRLRHHENCGAAGARRRLRVARHRSRGSSSTTPVSTTISSPPTRTRSPSSTTARSRAGRAPASRSRCSPRIPSRWRATSAGRCAASTATLRPGLDSHFYSGAKDECDAVRTKFPDAWVYESADVFQTVFPDRTTGSCPAGTAAVYRLYNQRADVNHRYTTDPAVRSQMLTKGYVPEGYGAGRRRDVHALVARKVSPLGNTPSHMQQWWQLNLHQGDRDARP